MSFFPCDMQRHRYKGPANHAYPAIVDGVNRDSRHWRFCAKHVLDLCEYLERYEATEEDSMLQVSLGSAACIGCDRVMDGLEEQLYVTVYGKGEDRRDFWAQKHRLCMLPDWLRGLWDATRDAPRLRGLAVPQDAPLTA
jgi:hypothetical protein